MAIHPPLPIYVVAQDWPLWLPSVLALNLPVGGVYIKEIYQALFPNTGITFQRCAAWPPDPLGQGIYLGSGSRAFFRSVFLPTIPSLYESSSAMFCLDVPFMSSRERNVAKARPLVVAEMEQGGMEAILLRHADFGGATSAAHLVAYVNVPREAFVPTSCTPRVLKHLMNSASRCGYAAAIDQPPPWSGDVPRTPLRWGDLFRTEGLLDAYKPFGLVACPSVFTQSKWTRRCLTHQELLRAFDMPVSMDDLLLESRNFLEFTHCVAPVVTTSIFRAWWGERGVGSGQETRGDGCMTRVREEKREELTRRTTDATSGIGAQEGAATRTVAATGIGGTATAEKIGGEAMVENSVRVRRTESPTEEADSVGAREEGTEELGHRDALDDIKRAHDLAKAVKSDDAQVPIHEWDFRVCRQPPSPIEVKALTTLRTFMLGVYRRKLLRDCRRFLSNKHGDVWWKGIGMSVPFETRQDKLAVREVVWRATENDWFEYTSGSRLHFFRFPAKYQQVARDGVKIFMLDAGPSSMKAQAQMKPVERAVLRDKLTKMIERQYLVPPGEKLKSIIQYFAVPKGTDDFRIVYHAGANNLNDSVWAPRFWLPRISSLLRIVDEDTWMQDRDIGEMFLNFELHPSVRKFTGVDVGPLGLEDRGISERWFLWTKNLMGFRPSPYNSVKLYLIAEEVIRGDRHDPTNAFRWDSIELNLPGTADYSPHRAWITKRRKDGSLASDMVCFMDDERLTGAGPERVEAAGHALSTRESYLGMQDALRKLRAAGGEKRPGAWAGAVVHNDDTLGVVLLTSQEKWDKTKGICAKWLNRLRAGDRELDFKELQSDRGFMVYVAEAYPAMKPYLKGFHLTLETWRGGRDAEGWKRGKRHASDDDQDWDLDIGWSKAALDIAGQAPESGKTFAVPRFRTDLEALAVLMASSIPAVIRIRSRSITSAIYGFGDASSAGFGATIERKDGVMGRYGLWGSDEESASSNFRELLNLVETVELEAEQGQLKDSELWLFTDNSTAESCFSKGSSSSELLHDLVLRLRLVEMSAGLILYVVHVAGTRMIAQGTDGLSRGVLMEGVMRGDDMLSFVELSRSALERHPPLLDYLRDWLALPALQSLLPQHWFVEGHGITGGSKNQDGMWIPEHAANGRTYLWAPPPVIGDVALEECLKAVHKRSDAYHVIVLPRLCASRWIRLFYKCCDFHFRLPAGSPSWPSHMHEPLWIGIVFPFLRFNPWSIRGTPLLVEVGRSLQEVLSSGETDGRDILRKLLRTQRTLCTVPEHVARGMLRMPRHRVLPDDGNDGRGGEHLAQTG